MDDVSHHRWFTSPRLSCYQKTGYEKSEVGEKGERETEKKRAEQPVTDVIEENLMK